MQLLHVTAEVEKSTGLFLLAKCLCGRDISGLQSLASHLAHSLFPCGILARTSQDAF
jgi:hypothetical protein